VDVVPIAIEVPDVPPWVVLGLSILVLVAVGLVWLIREVAKLNDSVDRVLNSAIGQAATAL
jgi:hypothetical protein